jgi:DNA-binding transcriptional LysR family regulator
VEKVDFWNFERWCRDVSPELATFYAACFYKTRKMAGNKLDKEGQSVGRSITRLETLLKEALGGGFLVDPEEQRSVEVTDAGDALLAYCREMESARASLMKKLKDMQSGSRLNVAITHYAWITYMAPLEEAYRLCRQDGALDVGNKVYGQDRVWEEIEQEVLEGRADIGVYSFPPSRTKELPADLSLMDWMEEEFVFVVPRDLARKIGRDRVSVHEVSEILPFLPRVVHYDRSLGFDRTDLIKDYLRRQRVLDRFEGDWLLGVNTIAQIKETLIRKGGISFLPWPTVQQEHKEGVLKAYRLNAPMRNRSLKIISRLHNCRGAVTDFCRAADSIREVKRFPI